MAFNNLFFCKYFFANIFLQIFFNNWIIKVNTCQSEHDALVCAAVRSTPSYKVTGTILVICTHHGLVQLNGVGDLQKGEK